MHNVLRRKHLTLLVLLALAAGCASAETAPAAAPGAGGAAEAGAVTLRVHNSDGRGERLTIFLVPQAGEHIRLGEVEPNAYLTVAHRGGQGRYQFRAQRPDGTATTSPSFDVTSGTYTWDMGLRRIDRSR